MKYRKKPVVVDAWKIVPITIDSKIPVWLFNAIFSTHEVSEDTDGGEDDYVINTLEGRMHAKKGDYIVRGVQGEIYSCKPDIFEATYEEVKE